jgi:hypothetical protein
LGSRVTIEIIFFFKFNLSCQQFDNYSHCLPPVSFATGVIYTGGEFAADVVDTSGNLPLVSLTPVANLAPASTTLAKLLEKFATSVVDTSGAP